LDGFCPHPVPTYILKRQTGSRLEERLAGPPKTS